MDTDYSLIYNDTNDTTVTHLPNYKEEDASSIHRIPDLSELYTFWFKGGYLSHVCLSLTKHYWLMSLCIAGCLFCFHLLASTSNPLSAYRYTYSPLFITLSILFIVSTVSAIGSTIFTIKTFWSSHKWFQHYHLHPKMTWEEILKSFIQICLDNANAPNNDTLPQYLHLTFEQHYFLCLNYLCRESNLIMVFAQHGKIPLNIRQFGLGILRFYFKPITLNESYRLDVQLFQQQDEKAANDNQSILLSYAEESNNLQEGIVKDTNCIHAHFETHLLEHSYTQTLVVKRIAILALIFSPIIGLFMIFLTLIKYMAKFRTNPRLLVERYPKIPTATGRCALRLYNELYHSWKYRMCRVEQYVDLIADMNPQLTQTWYEQVAHVVMTVIQWGARSILIPFWIVTIVFSLYGLFSSSTPTTTTTTNQTNDEQGISFSFMLFNSIAPILITGFFLTNTKSNKSRYRSKDNIAAPLHEQPTEKELLDKLYQHTHLRYSNITEADKNLSILFESQSIFILNDIWSIWKDSWNIWNWCRYTDELSNNSSSFASVNIRKTSMIPKSNDHSTLYLQENYNSHLQTWPQYDRLHASFL